MRKINTKLTLTSVKIHEDIFDEFKTICISSDFNLQKLVNRAMDLYNNDPDFKTKLEQYSKLVLSGSI